MPLEETRVEIDFYVVRKDLEREVWRFKRLLIYFFLRRRGGISPLLTPNKYTLENLCSRTAEDKKTVWRSIGY